MSLWLPLGVFGVPLASFGRLWAPFGSLWDALGLPLADFGLPLAPFWAPLGSLWLPLGRLGFLGLPSGLQVAPEAKNVDFPCVFKCSKPKTLILLRFPMVDTKKGPCFPAKRAKAIGLLIKSKPPGILQWIHRIQGMNRKWSQGVQFGTSLPRAGVSR